VIIVAGFVQGVQVSEALLGPELAGPFESTLALAAGRFHGTTAYGPALTSHRFVVHSCGLAFNVAFLSFNNPGVFALAAWQAGHRFDDLFFLPVAQLMELFFNPRPRLIFIVCTVGVSQGPEVLAGMVEVE
jgi:hypothetical protein